MIDGRWLVILLLEGAILGIFIAAVRKRDVAVATNALVSLVIVAIPPGLEVVLRWSIAPELTFGLELPMWLAIAGFLHSIGMLGPYDTVWWWDHLTHTVSGALVAALIYAGAIVAFRSGSGEPSMGLLAAVTISMTFAVGVLWELIELVARDVGERLDIEPMLVHYGWFDTGFDLVFDVAGALVVLILDWRTFVPIAEQFAGATGMALQASGVVVVAGCAALALIVTRHPHPEN